MYERTMGIRRLLALVSRWSGWCDAVSRTYSPDLGESVARTGGMIEEEEGRNVGS